MKYHIVEIFESLQGEGRNAGRPCIFVRFAGCNLNCVWCDTEITERFSISLEDLVKEIVGYRAKSVILTGGEPTIQTGMAELIAALHQKGYWVGVETNGSKSEDDAPWLEFVDYIACSPKVEFPDKVAIRHANEVRVVASSEKAVEFCRSLKYQIEATDYYVSPCDHDGQIDFATVKSVLGQLEGWSLSVQLHKLIGFR